MRGTLQFKAVGLHKKEDLIIRINGVEVPREYVTRLNFPKGQSGAVGVVLPAYDLYAVDLNWPGTKCPIEFGDNQLNVELVKAAEIIKGTVTIDELELYVYVRAVPP
ncbi:MAG: hypothetical protein JXM70_25580 [Pirellulales bacterium]|nr:hypothetical protein [Pirellulales bacterium]